MGIETGAKIITLAEAGLMDPDKFPFNKGVIVADNKFVKKAGTILKK